MCRENARTPSNSFNFQNVDAQWERIIAQSICSCVIRTSSAIPLKRWVLRTRPLRGQSRYYPNYVGHSPKPKMRFANF